MALIELWRDKPTTVLSLSIRQVVSIAGDGNLQDGSLAMAELREFLTKVNTERLETYVSQLIDDEREIWTGFVLQDLINEVGRRLGYLVDNGRYRGVRNQIGFDGVWTAPEQSQIVVEVKTSSTYELKLERLVGYRERLRGANAVGDSTSILLVVGNQETDGWESQIRGSRHAWDVRVVGASALTYLARLGDDDVSLLEKVRAMLVPREYTRLDGLIDLVLATSEASGAQDTDEVSDDEEDLATQASAFGAANSSDTERRKALVALFEKREGLSLDSKRGIIFSNAERSFSLLCSISKRHDSRRHGHEYWYSITPSQLAALASAKRSSIALGCADASMAFVFSLHQLNEFKERLGQSELNGRIRHWNIPLKSPEPGIWLLMLAERESIDVSNFLVAI